MRNTHLWNRAKTVNIQKPPDIIGDFDIGFDAAVPEETKDALMAFAYWVEDNFSLPVTLWVDVLHKHYLVDKSHKRVGYKFYWVDFLNYPVFENPDDIPVIELPVRRDIDATLLSFAEAITEYFAWLCNVKLDKIPLPDRDPTLILEMYYNSK